MFNKPLAVCSTLSVAVFAVACGGGGSALARFSGDGIRFTYPATWHAGTYEVPSSFSTSVVDLSPQSLHPPCITRHLMRSTTITCQRSVTGLRPGSMLTSWSIQTRPLWTFRLAQGSPLRVGGRPARIQVTRDSCGISADDLMEVVVAIPGRDQANSWYQLDACIRGPAIPASEDAVHELLRTVHFTT
jgi:hypothetical protein